ncbi:hypothetical protein OHU45_02120 [Streptomyces tubercidicus]|uniref:hypothetical protein n=1 Tax=Streptomyces tubercidicus TaxID=47759 RepID=UPI002E12F2A6|nr:hypothetical protein OG761_01945 [Streptomyces tubercidicus]WSX24652.1 hypothetical protein OG690_35885 [Streptomyces tubercidicus]
MFLTLPLVGVLAVLVALLIRKSGLRPAHAVPAVLLGFYLRDTTLAPTISEAVQGVVDGIGGIAP